MGNKTVTSSKNLESSQKSNSKLVDDTNTTVYLLGQKNSGKTTFLKVLSHLMDKSKGNTKEMTKELVELIQEKTKKFKDFCEKNSIQLKCPTELDSFEKFVAFYSENENLKALDQHYKELGISDGLYRLLRHKDLSDFYKTDDLFLYDNKITNLTIKIDKKQVNFVKGEVPSEPRETDFAFYFINASNYLEPNFFEEVNKDLKSIPLKSFIILTKVDLFLSKCYDNPVSKEHYYFHDQLQYISSKIKDGNQKLYPINLLSMKSNHSFLANMFSSFLGKVPLSKKNSTRKYKKLNSTRYQLLSFDLWKDILNYYDFSDEVQCLLLVSKDINKIVKDYLKEKWFILREGYQHINYGYHVTHSFQLNAVNVHFPDFHLSDINFISKCKKLEKVKLFSDFICNPRELFKTPDIKQRKYLDPTFANFKSWDGTEDFTEKKIVLLGCGESGKSTIFKHLLVLLKYYSIRDWNSYFPSIIENIWRITCQLLYLYIETYREKSKEVEKKFKDVLDFEREFGEFKDDYGYKKEVFEEILRFWCNSELRSFAEKMKRSGVHYHDGLDL